MRGSARIYDVRMAQFVLKIEKLSHIMGPRASQDLRSPSLIMAPGFSFYICILSCFFYDNMIVTKSGVLNEVKLKLKLKLKLKYLLERSGFIPVYYTATIVRVL